MSLGQLKTEDKSNEITAIPELLDALLIDGSTVTIDAMGCQTEIASKILERGGDYVLAVKGNQPLLLEGVVDSFRFLPAIDTHQTLDGDHGRIETRKYAVIEDLSMILNADAWPELRSIVRVDTESVEKMTGEVSTSTRYYITNLPPDARRMSRAIRAHWGIENQLHWMLDVGFDEDAGRKRNRNAVVNFSLLQKIALTMLKGDKPSKASVPNMRFKAALDPEYLLGILGG